MKVFINRIIPEAGLRLLREAGIAVVQWEQHREMTVPDLIAHCKDVSALLVAGRAAIDKPFLEACPHLKVISLLAVGFDNVDIATANELKIPIGHTPDVMSRATADIAFLLMQGTARKAFFHHKRIGNGDWGFFEPTAHLGIDLHHKTLGIFGLGKIGYEMAKSCRAAFDMKILYHNRSRNEIAERELGAVRVSFDTLVAKSDVISVHANLSEQTRNVFNAQAFAKMKNTAIFINTARGAVHDEAALLEALQNKAIWGAGLDVTDPEPMDKNNILLDMPNVVVLPHIGSATEQTRNNMAVLAAQNIIAGLTNQPLPKRVNPGF